MLGDALRRSVVEWSGVEWSSRVGMLIGLVLACGLLCLGWWSCGVGGCGVLELGCVDVRSCGGDWWRGCDWGVVGLSLC